MSSKRAGARAHDPRAAVVSSTWPTLLCLALGCAPSQSFRPAGSIPYGRDYEFGLALSNVRPRPYVNEATQPLGQAWWTLKLRDPWSLTAIAAFDTSSALAGAALRYEALSSRHVSIAPEAELGIAWAAISLPASLWLWRGTGIYTAPRIGNWGQDLTPFIPVGVSSELFAGFIVRGEVQVSWADFQYYNRRVHWGFAAAQQW